MNIHDFPWLMFLWGLTTSSAADAVHRKRWGKATFCALTSIGLIIIQAGTL